MQNFDLVLMEEIGIGLWWREGEERGFGHQL